MFGSELAAMIEAGAGLVVGTVDGEGHPRGTRAWGAFIVDAAARRLRIVVSADDLTVVGNLTDGRVAFTAADVLTFKSVQMKGRVLAVGSPTPEDLAIARDQRDRFFAAVVLTDGNPIELLTLMLPSEMVAIDVIVDEEFDQTPGPGAGAALRSAGR